MNLKKSITEKIILALVVALIAYLCSLIPGFYPTVWKGVVSSWKYLLGDASVPRWFLGLLLVVFSLYSLGIVLRIHGRLFKGPENYRHDVILHLPWRWEYYGSSITNLWCYCPECDTALVYRDSRDWSESGQGRMIVELTCEHCRRRVATYEGNCDYLVNSVKRQIAHNVRKGDWQKRIATTKNSSSSSPS
jgi:hypothetical protein